MRTGIVTNPRFGPETEAVLNALGGAQSLDYPTVLAGRAEPPDPDYAGTADPDIRVAELHLPLGSGPRGVRVYADAVVAPRPVLLWLHGGAFVGGAPRDLDAPCAAIARAAEVTIVSLDYRLAPEHPYPCALDDAYDALCWLAENGHVLGGDGRIVVGGPSAGGNLAAAVCLMTRDRSGPPVMAQVLCYPLLDFGQQTQSARLFDGVFHSVKAGLWPEHAYLAGQPVTPYAAPLRASSLEKLAPALVLGAGRDPLRDDARRYTRRLVRDGVSAQHLEYADTMHAFLNFSGMLSVADYATDAIAEYLRRLPARQ